MKKNVLTMIGLCLLSIGASAQVFNNLYTLQTGERMQRPKGKSILMQGCDVVTVNTVEDLSGQTDMQMTFTDPNGLFVTSYRYGDPTRDEICNGFIESINNPNEFLMVGQSGNNEMLVIKVNNTGNVLWSREIAFNQGSAEAITILSMYDPIKKGYIIVGNAGNEVAAVKMDDSGNIIWSNMYPMAASYVSNKATDARVSNALGLERVVAITGEHFTNTTRDIFVLTLNTLTGTQLWNPYIYSSPQGHRWAQPQLVEFIPATSTNPDYEVVLSYVTTQSQWSSTHKDLCMLQTNLVNQTNISWRYTYQKSGMSELFNADLIRMNSGRFSVLGTEHQLPGQYNAYTLMINSVGNFGIAGSYDEGVTEFAASSIENCSGNEMLTTYNGKDFRMVANDYWSTPCADYHVWDQIPLPLNLTQTLLNPMPNGALNNYWLQPDPMPFEIFDCFGGFIQKREDAAEEAASASKHPWFYPNPAASVLNITADSKPFTINLYNSLGQVVLSKQIIGNTSIEIDQLPRGVYTVEQTDESGYSKRESVVITR